MKKFLSLVLALALCLGLAAPAFAADAPAAPDGAVAAVIVTRNLRGDIDVYPQVAALKASYEKAGLDVILADAGNYLQGSVYAASDFGATIIDLMNEVGYAVAAVGEHEFDWGNATTGTENHGDLVQYKTLIDFAAAETGVKLLSANVIDADDETPFAPACSVTTESGLKIGFIGVTATDRAFDEGTIFEGYTVLSGDKLTSALNAAMARNNVDRTIELSATGETGVEVYFLDRAGEGEAVSVTLDENSPADAAVAAKVAAIKETQKDAPYAYSEVKLNGANRAGCKAETNLGDLWADALRWFATEGGIENYFDEDDVAAGNDSIAVDADHVVALWNGGNLKADISTGIVTETDLAVVLPYPNRVAVVYMTGSQLLEALEAASQGLPFTDATAAMTNAFMQVSGVKYTADAGKAFDAGDKYGASWHKANSIQRVTIDEINGAAFDESATYAVVTSNANYNGMDSSYVFKAAQAADSRSAITTAVVRDVVWLYIKNQLGGVIGSEYAEPQGRITINTAYYTDVPADAAYRDALAFVGSNGLMNGTGVGRFEPDGPMTRATFATVLWRYAGKPTVATPATFVDADEAWYLDAIAWAQSVKAIEGYGDDVFGCDDPVTREDAATILWRLMGKPEAGIASAGYTDLDDVFDYAYTAVKWALATGILESTDGAIQPKRVATRAELTVLLMNYDAAVRAASEN